jgi:hypothetical protein
VIDSDASMALATLIFATMAGIGSLIRVYQNERFYRWNKRIHKRSQGTSKHRTNAPNE